MDRMVPGTPLVLRGGFRRIPFTYVVFVLAAFSLLPAVQPKAFWFGIVGLTAILAVRLQRTVALIATGTEVMFRGNLRHTIASPQRLTPL